MKKVSIVILVFAFASKAGVAQTQYKFEKGSVMTELQLSLFSRNQPISMSNQNRPISMPTLNLRFGLSDKLVFRTALGLNFGHDNNKETYDNDTTWLPSSDMAIRNGYNFVKRNSTQFSIAPGIEYHLGNWERLSVYVGGELFFGMEITRSNNESKFTVEWFHKDYWGGSGEYEHTGTSEFFRSVKGKNGGLYNSQNGHMFFGVAILAGMDFYIYKGLYLGAELGLGYTNSIALKSSLNEKITEKLTDASGNVISDTETTKEEKFEDKISNGGLGFRCNPMIRFGWRF